MAALAPNSTDITNLTIEVDASTSAKQTQARPFVPYFLPHAAIVCNDVLANLAQKHI
jgi:hypothetical protein